MDCVSMFRLHAIIWNISVSRIAVIGVLWPIDVWNSVYSKQYDTFIALLRSAGIMRHVRSACGSIRMLLKLNGNAIVRPIKANKQTNSLHLWNTLTNNICTQKAAVIRCPCCLLIFSIGFGWKCASAWSGNLHFLHIYLTRNNQTICCRKQ